MGLLKDALDDDLPGPAPLPVRTEGPRRRGWTRGVFVLAIVNALLAGFAIWSLWFVFRAENYLLNDSAEIGTDLQQAQIGIRVIRFVLIALIAGFVLSAIGILSATQTGRFIQRTWALLLCITIVGLLYGVPALLVLGRSDERARFQEA